MSILSKENRQKLRTLITSLKNKSDKESLEMKQKREIAKREEEMRIL